MEVLRYDQLHQGGLPDRPGERIPVYGGSTQQNHTFYSAIHIDIAAPQANQAVEHDAAVMAYLRKGHGIMNGRDIESKTLLRSDKGLKYKALSESQLIFVYKYSSG